MKNISYSTAMELAYGKGKTKKWALEIVLLNALYESKESACYIKLEDISNIKADIETDEELILRYGYLYRIPRTEIQLHIVKKNNKMYLTKEVIGFGYEEVEMKIIDFLFSQKLNGNLIYKSSYNNECFKIK